ncbi:MAG: MotA/TolQ/ExbB proton channel family protein [Campylobacterales bacterium]
MDSVLAFLNQGGLPLWLIAAVAFVLWTLVLAHHGYLLTAFARERAGLLERYRQARALAPHQRADIKRALLAFASQRFAGPLPLLKTLVAIAPLLGLLGTVMGMIEVFDVLSALGTGDARSMASGVARATLPTMAGMVLAILGLFFISRFESFKERQLRRLEDAMGAA